MLIVLVVYGLIFLIPGMYLFAKWTRSRGVLKTRDTYISAAVSFILIAFGLALIVAGIILTLGV